MKKIMIAAAIVCAAAFAQAATFKWAAANIYVGNTTDKYSGAVQIYVAAAGTGEYSLLDTATASGGAFSLTKAYDTLVGGNYYDAYWTISDAKLGTFTSSVKENQLASATQQTSVGWGNMAVATQNKANWVNAPEPTSGLLLLLGMGALALRRRRA